MSRDPLYNNPADIQPEALKTHMRNTTRLSRRSFAAAITAAPWVAARAQQAPLHARVKVDTERVIGDIDPKIYGNFIEHLGRCIEGGVFDEKSPLSDSNGFRKDVLDAVKDLNVSVLRWPGGNFSSNYHWTTASSTSALEPGPKRSNGSRYLGWQVYWHQ